MHIEKASPGCGAIVTGIDIRSISDSEFQLIYEAWLEAGVICIRGQELTIEDFLSYGRRFGEIFPHLVKKITSSKSCRTDGDGHQCSQC